MGDLRVGGDCDFSGEKGFVHLLVIFWLMNAAGDPVDGQAVAVGIPLREDRPAHVKLRLHPPEPLVQLHIFHAALRFGIDTAAFVFRIPSALAQNNPLIPCPFFLGGWDIDALVGKKQLWSPVITCIQQICDPQDGH